MKALFLLLSLLVASPAWGAFTSAGTLGETDDGCYDSGGATTCVLTTTATVEAGNLIVWMGGADNQSGSDGDQDECGTVADSAGNTYTLRVDFQNGQGGADLGTVACIFTSVATTQLTSGGTITQTWANSQQAKVGHAWEFTKGAGTTVNMAGSATSAQDGSTDPESISISGLPSKEYLFLRIETTEHTSGTNWTATSGYTLLGNSRTTGAPTNPEQQNLKGEFIIATATGHTSDPTLAVSARDAASIFVALEEVMDQSSSQML